MVYIVYGKGGEFDIYPTGAFSGVNGPSSVRRNRTPALVVVDHDGSTVWTEASHRLSVYSRPPSLATCSDTLSVVRTACYFTCAEPVHRVVTLVWQGGLGNTASRSDMAAPPTRTNYTTTFFLVSSISSIFCLLCPTNCSQLVPRPHQRGLPLRARCNRASVSTLFLFACPDV